MHRLIWLAMAGATLLLFSMFGCRFNVMVRPDDGIVKVEGSTDDGTDASTSADLVAQSGSQPGFYPLTIGNRWRYTRTLLTDWADSSGTPQHFVVTEAEEHQIVCFAPVGDRYYSAERRIDPADPGAGGYSIYYRQDRSGLYELDGGQPPCLVPVGPAAWTTAPARREVAGRRPTDHATLAAVTRLEYRSAMLNAALGRGLEPGPARGALRPRPLAGEITRLAYPLLFVRHWVIREDPRFACTVEGIDWLRLPAGRFWAYRIRIDSELFAPSDRVHVWYNRKGFMKLDGIFETQVVDDASNPVAIATSRQTEVLDAIHLVTPQPVP